MHPAIIRRQRNSSPGITRHAAGVRVTLLMFTVALSAVGAQTTVVRPPTSAAQPPTVAPQSIQSQTNVAPTIPLEVFVDNVSRGVYTTGTWTLQPLASLSGISLTFQGANLQTELFWMNWSMAIFRGSLAARDVVVVARAPGGQVLQRWIYQNAWPYAVYSTPSASNFVVNLAYGNVIQPSAVTKPTVP